MVFKLLAEIRDVDLGLPVLPVSTWRERIAARAVLRSGSLIALLYVSRLAYYKLPGGGVEQGEDIASALSREIFEEVGCGVIVEAELGAIIEFRSDVQLTQISHCFLAQAEGSGVPLFTEQERANGFELKWFSITDAIDLLEQCTPADCEGRFIVRRDCLFLKAAQAQMR